MRIWTASNDALDFHPHCAPSEANALKRYGKGEGPDGRGNCFSYDSDHPPYEDDDYRCHKCHGRLKDED